MLNADLTLKGVRGGPITAKPREIPENRRCAYLVNKQWSYPYLSWQSFLLLLGAPDTFHRRSPLKPIALPSGCFGSKRDIAETLINVTPLIHRPFSGFSFKCGLFNIGAEGQFIMGQIVAAWIGFQLTGLPTVIHAGVSCGSACRRPVGCAAGLP